MPCGRWHLAITAGASTVRPSYGPHQPVYLRSAWEVAAEIADYQDSGLEVVGVIGIAGSPSICLPPWMSSVVAGWPIWITG